MSTALVPLPNRLRTQHFDGLCGAATCHETRPHHHGLCPGCGAMWLPPVQGMRLERVASGPNPECYTCRRIIWPDSVHVVVEYGTAEDLVPLLLRLLEHYEGRSQRCHRGHFVGPADQRYCPVCAHDLHERVRLLEAALLDIARAAAGIGAVAAEPRNRQRLHDAGLYQEANALRRAVNDCADIIDELWPRRAMVRAHGRRLRRRTVAAGVPS